MDSPEVKYLDSARKSERLMGPENCQKSVFSRAGPTPAITADQKALRR